MSRKDFELIAGTIKALAVEPADRAHIASAFCHALRTTNEAFNSAKFMRACGVPANG